MFGLKLIKRDEEDAKEVRVFKKAVHNLHDHCTDLIKWIIDGFNVDPDSILHLISDMEVMGTLIDIYFNNKFSSPTNSMRLFQTHDECRKYVNEIVEIINGIITANELVRTAYEHREDGSIDIDQINDEYEKLIDSAKDDLNRSVNLLIAEIKLIIAVIRPDLVRIDTGENLIETYYRNKALKDNSDKMHTMFKVEYKVQPDEYRRYLNKEKTKEEKKNDQRRKNGN